MAQANDEICFRGLCKLNRFHECGGVLDYCTNTAIQSDKTTFADLSFLQADAEYCVSVEGPQNMKQCVYKGAVFVKKRQAQRGSTTLCLRNPTSTQPSPTEDSQE